MNDLSLCGCPLFVRIKRYLKYKHTVIVNIQIFNLMQKGTKTTLCLCTLPRSLCGSLLDDPLSPPLS